jgi:hypothetical protein
MNVLIKPFQSNYPCVQCGKCCKDKICQFGEYGKDLKCRFLKLNKKNGKYYCKIHDKIINHPFYETSPWKFGGGCPHATLAFHYNLSNPKRGLTYKVDSAKGKEITKG